MIDSLENRATEAVRSWYDGLRRFRNGMPAKGSVAVGLVVLDRLKSKFELNPDAHRTAGGGQVSGVSKQVVQRILSEFGENRTLSEIAGRSNRGSIQAAEELLAQIDEIGLDREDESRRNSILTLMQRFLVRRVSDYFSRERLKPVFDPATSTRRFIADLLKLAHDQGKCGAVAEYLVGAKLQLRFPNIEVRNESFAAADEPSGHPGDFLVGQTVFHITVSPNADHYEKCRRNLSEGFRVYLLVPDAVVIGARQNAENIAIGKIAVESVESFVSQNIEELGEFSASGLTDGLSRLLILYNARVDEIEHDKSLLIDVPPNVSN